MEFTTGHPAEAAPTAKGTDARGAPRFTSLIRSAKIVSGQGEFVCVVRDVSSSGVSLRTFHDLPTDESVALELQNGEAYEMELVRKSGRDASYRFDRPIAVERLINESWDYPKRQLRLAIAMPLTISSLTGKAEAITLNMSQQGARIECDSVFAIDQTVRVQSEFMPEIRCKVRWRKDSNYGVVFDNTFTLQEFALLAARLQCPLLLDESDR